MKSNIDLLIATGIYPPDIGGPATYSQLLMTELPKKGFLVTVVNFGEVRSLPKIVRHLVYTWHVFKFGRRARVIYAQDPVSVGLPVMIASFLLRKSYILKVVGDYAWEQGYQRFNVVDLLDDFSVKTSGYPWTVRFLKWVEKTVARRAVKIIVPSNYLKKIVTNWGIEPAKIKVVYNSFDTPTTELPNKDELRQKFGFIGSIIISTGRLVPWKGFSLLIDVMAEMIFNNPILKFYIIGDGPDRDRLTNLIKDKKMTEKIFLVGRMEHSRLLEFLKAADIFVLNTAYEGFSHQLLEVMWCGTPIITTDVGGNTELISDKNNGLLVGYNNRLAIKNALEFLLNNKEIATKLTVAAKQKLSSFNREKMFQELIQEIL